METRTSTDNRWENQIYGHCGVNQGDRLCAPVQFFAEKKETLKNTFTAKTQPEIGLSDIRAEQRGQSGGNRVT